MALINCPECNAQVSDKAEACPRCAYPLAGGGTTQAHAGKIQTVEQTSKRFKLQELLSALLVIGSIFFIIIGLAGSGIGSGNPSLVALGFIGSLGGLIWFIAVRFLVWWHHG